MAKKKTNKKTTSRAEGRVAPEQQRRYFGGGGDPNKSQPIFLAPLARRIKRNPSSRAARAGKKKR